MHKSIEIKSEVVNGLNITCVTDTESEFLRVAVVVPFDPRSIINGTVPYEVPHVLEHTLLRGPRSQSSNKFRTYLQSDGGSYNGLTSMTINGHLSFETTQPDTGVKQALALVRAAVKPALRPAELEEEKQIVRNELEGYLQNPFRQRQNRMFYIQNQRYETDDLGLSNLADIDLAQLQVFHNTFMTPSNMRVVLSGSQKATAKLVDAVAKIAVPDDGATDRYVAASGDTLQQDDYHAEAPEIPEGMTTFYQLRAYNGSLLGSTVEEMAVIAGAFSSHVTEGEDGVVNQSRRQGISYGPSIGWYTRPTQSTLTLADTTSVGQTPKQIALLEDILKRTEDGYTTENYSNYRNTVLGRLKIQPPSLLRFAPTVEQLAAVDRLPYAVDAHAFRKALNVADPTLVVEGVKRIAWQMRNPSFINQYSFGDNPFASE